jgi:hypothetical protein
MDSSLQVGYWPDEVRAEEDSKTTGIGGGFGEKGRSI